jgi:hypothetical protein
MKRKDKLLKLKTPIRCDAITGRDETSKQPHLLRCPHIATWLHFPVEVPNRSNFPYRLCDACYESIKQKEIEE